MIQFITTYIQNSYHILKYMVNKITLFFSYVTTFIYINIQKPFDFIDYVAAILISWTKIIILEILENLIDTILTLLFVFLSIISELVSFIFENVILPFLDRVVWLAYNFEESGHRGVFNLIFITCLTLLALVFNSLESNFWIISSTWTNGFFWFWLLINLLYLFNNPYWQSPEFIVLETINYFENKLLIIPNNFQIGNSWYSTTASSSETGPVLNEEKEHDINPWYLTGFTDGDGSFTFSIKRAHTNQTGWGVSSEFYLVAANNPANRNQFELIKQFFGFGTIVIKKASAENRNSIIQYRVIALEDCVKIRDHFLKYPLLTYKLVHFQLWCQVIDLRLKNEHLTLEGLNRIVALKEHSPLGISDTLKLNFPNYIPQSKPVFNLNIQNMNIHWIAGFINADGSFKVHVRKSEKSILGFSAAPFIQITQHSNSLVTLQAIQSFLGLGTISKFKNVPAYNFTITNLKDANLFLEQFKTAKLWGAKALDYNDFLKNIDLINKGLHLTKEGLEKINKINANVNSRRTNFSIEDQAENQN